MSDLEAPEAAPAITDVLNLEEVDQGVFEAPPAPDDRPRVFGGQILAQALAAASFTVDGSPCHSLHAYFLRPGKPGRPIHYEVNQLRDGKRFAVRQVIAVQRDEPICQLSASFQHDEGDTLAHQVEAPDVPDPDALPDEHTQKAALADKLPEAMRARVMAPGPIEMRPVDVARPWFQREPQAPDVRTWLRARQSLPDHANLHRCVLTYATDLLALHSCIMPVPAAPFDPDLQFASLDHSLWFHRPLRADDWLLYSGTSDSVSEGRGSARAQIFNREGHLVASMAQEGVLTRLPSP